jgi:hypothetical protein
MRSPRRRRPASAIAKPDQQGRFRISGLPPGKYVAAVVDALEPGAEFDPDVLERLEPLSSRLTVGEGETKSVALKLISF